MAAPSWKKYLKTSLKFVISGAALYVVFQNIDWDQTRQIFLSTEIWPLVIASIFFILSKILSAYRLDLFFKNISLFITSSYNLRLYWVGMFYNLFLPGGIGGDGYKVYVLNRQFKLGVKPLASAAFLDRLSGVVAICFLIGIGYFLIPGHLPDYILWLAIVLMILLFPIHFFTLRTLFKKFISTFWTSNIFSIAIQFLQTVSAYFILLSLGVENHFIEYLVIFLVSSLVVVFPFTIGGIGARELTFILAYQYFGIDQNTSVAFSFLFFIITALVSVIGGFLPVNAVKSNNESKTD